MKISGYEVVDRTISLMDIKPGQRWVERLNYLKLSGNVVVVESVTTGGNIVFIYRKDYQLIKAAYDFITFQALYALINEDIVQV